MNTATLVSDLQDRIIFNLEQQGIYEVWISKEITRLTQSHRCFEDLIQAIPQEIAGNSDLMFSVRRALMNSAYDIYNQETCMWDESIIEEDIVEEFIEEDAVEAQYDELKQFAEELLERDHVINIADNRAKMGDYGADIYYQLANEGKAYIMPGFIVHIDYKYCNKCKELKHIECFSNGKEICDECRPSKRKSTKDKEVDFKVVYDDDLITYQSMVTDYLRMGYDVVTANISVTVDSRTLFYAMLVRR